MEEYYRHIAEAERAVEFLQEDLDLLQGHGFHDLIYEKDQMISLRGNLRSLRSFLKGIRDSSSDHEELPHLVKQIRNATAALLDTANTCLGNVFDQKVWTSNLIGFLFSKQAFQSKKDRFLEGSLRIDFLVKVMESTGYELNGGVLTDNGSSADNVEEVGNSLSKESDNHILQEDIMVGFNDDSRALLEEGLMGNQMQLEVFSIIGMAGIGKTTLAKRLYDDESVVYHFHIRGWASVSQTYDKDKLLSGILSCILDQKDSICSIGDPNIGEKLFKGLKRRRYLIVIDDIWDVEAWNDIKMYFPNDGNGSRILITTRITDVASKASNNPPHCLPFLSPAESWQLFTHKVFSDKSCPHSLIQIGKEIVAKCKGLPLAIVVVAGLLLKKEKTHQIWSHVAQNIGQLIDSNTEQLMDILALSYEHLPQHLKLCFLYLGTFPEDDKIPVKILIGAWIAEGYVKQTEEKRPEDLAEDYLMELINRSLVIVAKTRSIGGAMTCHIHDTVRELCIRKALGNKLTMPPSGSNREFIAGWSRYHENNYCTINLQMPFIGFHFLRVLDLRRISYDVFPKKILELVHLKYLALEVKHISKLPRRLYLLRNLETFILHIEKGRRITVPYEIWKMEKLRHLEIPGELEFENKQGASVEWKPPTLLNLQEWYISFIISKLKSLWNWSRSTSPSLLTNLQTISQLCPSGPIEKTLERTPNLRKLGLHLISSERREFSFPNLAGLKLLESLNFEFQTHGWKSINLPQLNQFPPSLRKLTLIGSHVNWAQMSILAMLPNLEVLKLKDNFFSGPRWETSEYGFPCLRFLKLSHLDLQQWITSECHFPKLEQLVLNACLDLVEIPSAMGEIFTLQGIKVYGSSDSVADSAWQIQESQRSFGNAKFKVFIYPHFEEYVQV